MANNTDDRGLGSPNMDEKKKHDIQSAGGKAGGSANTDEQEEARKQNIKKAQEARRKQ